jgi:hypothetical protein
LRVASADPPNCVRLTREFRVISLAGSQVIFCSFELTFGRIFSVWSNGDRQPHPRAPSRSSEDVCPSVIPRISRAPGGPLLPIREIRIAREFRADPNTVLHVVGVDAFPPARAALLGKIDEWTVRDNQVTQFLVDLAAGSDCDAVATDCWTRIVGFIGFVSWPTVCSQSETAVPTAARSWRPPFSWWPAEP